MSFNSDLESTVHVTENARARRKQVSLRESRKELLLMDRKYATSVVLVVNTLAFNGALTLQVVSKKSDTFYVASNFVCFASASCLSR